jgi:hypothetical protein
VTSSDSTRARWPTCSTRPWNRSTAPSNGPAPACRAAGSRRPPSANRLPPPTHPPSRRSWQIRPRLRVRNLGGLVALLTDDIFVSMPSIPLEYQGRDVVAGLFASIFGSGRRVGLVPTRANGQPAFGAYLRASTGIRHGSGLSSSPSPATASAPSPDSKAACSHRSGYRDRSRADNQLPSGGSPQKDPLAACM